MKLFTAQDLVLVIVYVGIIYAIALRLRSIQREKGLDSQYFIGGLTAKLIGVTAFCFIYGIVYGDGDTVQYYRGAVAMSNLPFENFDAFFDILVNNNLSKQNFAQFNGSTGFPPHYMWKDSGTFSVVRYSTIFCFIGAKSFFVTSMLIASFSYIGIWKVYRLFQSLYPETKKALAISILFLPSLLFWGSGIMKDSFVLSSTCWFTYNFYHVFIIRKKVVPNLFLLIINLGIIISIKPYIILSLLPGALLWLNNAYLKQMASKALKYIMMPVIGVFVLGAGAFLYQNMGSLMGDYGNIDQAVEKAKVIKQDLLRSEQYGTNNYDLGEINGSVSGLASIAPMAIFTALYRPLFFEIGSVMMIITTLENTALLFFTFLLFYRIRWRNMIRILLGEPLIMYSVFFSLLLAFGVGMASTNFGALSRYKLPFMPFYFSALYLIYFLNTHKEERII